MGYKRKLKTPREYGTVPSLFTERGAIRGDIPRQLAEALEETGKILDAFNVSYLKKIVYPAMYYCYRIDRR